MYAHFPLYSPFITPMSIYVSIEIFDGSTAVAIEIIS